MCIFAVIPYAQISAQETKVENMNDKISIDGKEINFSNPTYTIDDKTYVPLREMFETIGYEVTWLEDEQLIRITSKKQDDSDEWLIFQQNQKSGYMDQYGNIKIEAQYDWAYDFVDGIARVGNFVENRYQLPAGVNDTRWGFINEKGEIITPIHYAYAWDFNEGLALVEEENGECYYIDQQGNRSQQKVVGTKFITQGFVPKLIEGGAPFPMPNPPMEVWTYVDHNGEVATSKRFEKAREFEGDLAVVKNNGKYGLIDTNFSTVIDYCYEDLTKIDEDLYAAKKGDKWGIVDTKGNVIVDFDYFDIGKFSNGFASVRSDQINGAYIDRSGQLFYTSRFRMVYDFFDGYACVVDKENGKAGVIDCSGNYVIEPTYYSLQPTKIGGIFEAKDNHGLDSYYITLNGTQILPH